MKHIKKGISQRGRKMFGLFKKKSHKQVEEKIELQIKDLQLYLENNYKDLAIKARKDAIKLLEESYSEGRIDDKHYTQYKKTLDEYTTKMANYNHQQFYRT